MLSIHALCWRLDTRRNCNRWDELRSFPTLSPEEQQRQLAARLLQTLHYYGNREDALPEWREAAHIRDPLELWRAWPSLPILTKSEIRNRFPAEGMAERFGLTGRVDSTGGSTGEPIRFFVDSSAARNRVSLDMHSRQSMGWRPGMPTTVVWGSERDIGKSERLRNRLWHSGLGIHIIDGFRFSDRTASEVVRDVRRYRRLALYGYSSLLEAVARRVLQSGNLPPRHVAVAWNGGEVLLPCQRELFLRAFGTPLLNRYGGRELGIMACQYLAGGPLHVLRPWRFVEVVDRHGRPAAAGELGRLLWTCTDGKGTPFLRYDIGDVGVFAAAHCDEAGIRALAEIDGRTAGVLELRDGTALCNLYWNHLLKEYPEVEQFQVVIGAQSLKLLFRGTSLAPERQAALRQRLRIVLGEMPVTISRVEQIPRTGQGKLLQVVRVERAR